MKLKSIAAAGIVALGVTVGAAGCGLGAYTPAYVVSRTMCGNQYCVIMSDGDVVTVNQSIWDSILYGMIISSSRGTYHFTASSSPVRTRKITTVSYSKYRSVTRVNPATEASQEQSGATYNNGGSKYTTSPKYQASAKASAAQQKASKQSSTGSVKFGYPTAKAKSPTIKISKGTGGGGYSPAKITYSSSKKGGRY